MDVGSGSVRLYASTASTVAPASRRRSPSQSRPPFPRTISTRWFENAPGEVSSSDQSASESKRAGSLWISALPCAPAGATTR